MAVDTLSADTNLKNIYAFAVTTKLDGHIGIDEEPEQGSRGLG